MRAEIIATGSELLTGRTVDTNSLFLADGLLDLGIETAFKSVVGDDEKNMEEVFRRALDRAEVIVITGGLGPTEDDITRKVLARMLKKRLVLNEKGLEFAILTGLATRCAISPQSRFARRNYFYPDLPKVYQISQYELVGVRGRTGAPLRPRRPASRSLVGQ